MQQRGAANGSDPGNIGREVDGGCRRKLGRGDVRPVGGAIIAGTGDDGIALLRRDLLVEIGVFLTSCCPALSESVTSEAT